MAKKKISERVLRRLIEQEGYTQGEAAEYFGVQRPAVCKACKRYGIGESAMKSLPPTVEDTKVQQEGESGVPLDPIAQLRKINQAINQELDRAIAELSRPKRRTKMTRDHFIRLSAEIRQQLNVSLNMASFWRGQQGVREFQDEVIKLLGEIDPKVRDEFIRRIRERKSLRRAVSVD